MGGRDPHIRSPLSHLCRRWTAPLGADHDIEKSGRGRFIDRDQSDPFDGRCGGNMSGYDCPYSAADT